MFYHIFLSILNFVNLYAFITYNDSLNYKQGPFGGKIFEIFFWSITGKINNTYMQIVSPEQ